MIGIYLQVMMTHIENFCIMLGQDLLIVGKFSQAEQSQFHFPTSNLITNIVRQSLHASNCRFQKSIHQNWQKGYLCHIIAHFLCPGTDVIHFKGPRTKGNVGYTSAQFLSLKIKTQHTLISLLNRFFKIKNPSCQKHPFRRLRKNRASKLGLKSCIFGFYGEQNGILLQKNVLLSIVRDFLCLALPDEAANSLKDPRLPYCTIFPDARKHFSRPRVISVSCDIHFQF